MPLQPISDQPITKMCRIFAECIWCKFSCGKLKAPSLTQINFCDSVFFVGNLSLCFHPRFFVRFIEHRKVKSSKNSVHDGIKFFLRVDLVL
ncbi:hypothetical protein T02_3918 [Trichinella nativa]|uniref:Uncharacterized protein n=1 Tax=Trichinella nativa TaxID=6335 RepID=A0A0V1KKH7_9BILA|nr:hypothetical protein T02_3918 [Trichinella nativa]